MKQIEFCEVGMKNSDLMVYIIVEKDTTTGGYNWSDIPVSTTLTKITVCLSGSKYISITLFTCITINVLITQCAKYWLVSQGNIHCHLMRALAFCILMYILRLYRHN